MMIPILPEPCPTIELPYAPQTNKQRKMICFGTPEEGDLAYG